MRLKYITILLCLIGLIYACVDADDDFKKIDYSEVDFGIGDETLEFNVVINDTATIAFDPIFSDPNDSFIYEWYIVDSLVATTDEPMYKQKITAMVGKYPCCVIAKHHPSNVIAGRASFNLNIVTPYSLGWMILYKEDGKAKIGHINEIPGVNPDELTYDLNLECFKSVNGYYLTGEPKKLIYHTVGSMDQSDLDNVLVLMKDGTGSIDVHTMTLRAENLMEKEFYGKQFPANFDPQNVIYAVRSAYIINGDGKVYCKTTGNQDNITLSLMPWSEEPMRIEDSKITKGINIGFVLQGGYPSHSIFYDGHNKKIMYAGDEPRQNDNAEIKDIEPYVGSLPVPYAPLDNLGMDVIYIGGGYDYNPIPQFSGHYSLVMKDAAGDYYYQGFYKKAQWMGMGWRKYTDITSSDKTVPFGTNQITESRNKKVKDTVRNILILQYNFYKMLLSH